MTKWRIPLVDLEQQYQRIREEMEPALQAVLTQAQFIGGPAVAAFERQFAEFCGVRYVVGVGNGTDALYVTLRALGIGPDDEVILPSHTFIATSEAVRLVGARPVFADISAETFNLDPAEVERKITACTKAILPVHLYGQPAALEALTTLAKRHQLLLVGDAAQAHGASYCGTPIARFGNATTFSFYPGKNLGAYGDGGAVATDDEALAKRIRMIANHGRTQKYVHDLEGVNSRLDGLQAAVLAVKLRHLADWNECRRRCAVQYTDLLRHVAGVQTPNIPEEATHVMHLYVIRVPAERRESLLASLRNDGIDAGIHYPVPLHLQPCYRSLGYAEGSLPVTETVAREIVSLPMFPELTADQVTVVADAVKRYVC
ncbi:MAG: DegT/DnrJ/EryC1/StrS family aminotransferase [Deltaproteobacteria bacterium]|nr:DegT/DnrJ/EryC1/StrS family aminotransferase [Deltaproteobacteria bacterium]